MFPKEAITDSIQKKTSLVFTDAFRERLQLQIETTRQLKAMGVRVTHTDALQERPLITVDATTVKALCRLGSGELIDRKTGQHSVRFNGCDVVWREVA